MAQRETGRFDPTGQARAARPAPPSPALVLLAVLAIGFVTAVLGPALRSPPEGELWDGSWTASFEDALMEGTALRSAASVTWGVLDLTVFRQGLPGVLIGRDGWLFTAEEFAPSAVPERFTVPAPVQEVAAVAERLRGDGVDLLAVLVPAKARVHDEALGRYELPEATRARYPVLLQALREAGVDVVDGAAALGSVADEDAFLRTDTHWTPAGAAAIAERVAARAASRNGDAAWFGATRYRVESSGTLRVEGDLLEFVPLGPFRDALGPPADRIPQQQVTPAEAAADPFAEVRLPVTLVGTSYSADERWGFADRLRAALGADVLVAASEGEGPYAPMRAYLDGEAYRNARPELVVWEIPERYAWPEVGW